MTDIFGTVVDTYAITIMKLCGICFGKDERESRDLEH